MDLEGKLPYTHTLVSNDQDQVQDRVQDYLEIKDGPSDDSQPLVGKLSGNVIPDAIQSSQKNLWMK